MFGAFSVIINLSCDIMCYVEIINISGKFWRGFFGIIKIKDFVKLVFYFKNDKVFLSITTMRAFSLFIAQSIGGYLHGIV